MKTSVALCTYNGGKYLQEQLDSILQQNIPVDEIVVCDYFTDKSALLFETFKSLHLRIV